MSVKWDTTQDIGTDLDLDWHPHWLWKSLVVQNIIHNYLTCLSTCLATCLAVWMSVKWATTHDIGADLDLDRHPLLTLEISGNRTTKYNYFLHPYLENASKLLKIMKYLTKITKNILQFSCDTRISSRTAIFALFSKPATRQVTCDTSISPRTAISGRFQGR